MSRKQSDCWWDLWSLGFMAECTPISILYLLETYFLQSLKMSGQLIYNNGENYNIFKACGLQTSIHLIIPRAFTRIICMHYG